MAPHCRPGGGARAIDANLSDEQFPTPHYTLFARMLAAVEARGAAPAVLDELLHDTNLVFYFGYFVSPDFAIGALFGTELMLAGRAQSMLEGLTRLGFNEQEREFMQLHALCDEMHAQSWLADIIESRIADEPAARKAIEEGLAVRLETSRAYLDRLLSAVRAQPASSAA